MTYRGLTTAQRQQLTELGARPCPHCGRLLMAWGQFIGAHKIHGTVRCPASDTPWPPVGTHGDAGTVPRPGANTPT